MRRLDRVPEPDCRCSPAWPALETVQNGYTMSAVPAVQGSVWTVTHDLTAHCAQCGATYPGQFVLAPGTPPPFAWARDD